VDYQAFYSGLMGVLVGTPMLVSATKKKDAAERAQRSRLHELKTGRDERFFEERRSLEAYPPFKSILGWRVAGAFFLIGGIFLIVLSVLR